MARAIYADADIYLLDDPLSAVDPRVAKAIFEEGIRKALKDKIVILCTHQLQFCKNMQKVLVLKKGEQVMLDSFQIIKQNKMNIQAILESYTKVMAK